MHCPRRFTLFPGDADTLLEVATPTAPELVATVAPEVVAPVATIPDDLDFQNLLFGGSSYDVCLFMWIR